MSNMRTFECRLTPSYWEPPSKFKPGSVASASDDTKAYLWGLSVESAHLCKKLNERIVNHELFENWAQSAKIPDTEIKKVWKELKDGSTFEHIPERFCKSALITIQNIYSSWFSSRKKLQNKLKGLEHSFSIIKSDIELASETGIDIEQIQARAEEILASLKAEAQASPDVAKQAKNSLISSLFELYDEAEQGSKIDKAAIVHLIKNGCKIAACQENSKKFEEKRLNKQKLIERIEKKLEGKTPEIRDFPLYPIVFYSSDDLRWLSVSREDPKTKDIKERIFVTFKGMGRNRIFEICCGRRQLPMFQTFLEDWQLYQRNKKEYSLSMVLLRSASLVWHKCKERRSKEAANNLMDAYEPYLKVTIDIDNLTAEGAGVIRDEKLKDVEQRIRNYEKIAEAGGLTPNQQTDLKRLESRGIGLGNSFPRPSKPTYKGNADIAVGISFSRQRVMAAAVVDLKKGKAIVYRTAQQLLGKDYSQISNYRHRQRTNRSKRRKLQMQRKNASITEAGQGVHLDRVLAKAVVELAQEYNSGVIVLPKTSGLREIIQSGIEAMAEQKYPKDKSRQRQFLKEYRINVHNWDYLRLRRSIEERAGKVGIPMRVGCQSSQGDLPQKAQQVALSALERVS